MTNYRPLWFVLLFALGFLLAAAAVLQEQYNTALSDAYINGWEDCYAHRKRLEDYKDFLEGPRQ